MLSGFRIRRMGAGDLPFAQSLRALAGWNQTDADWQRLLRHDPEGCFIAEAEGKPIGTATTTVYGEDLAWIGMLLVHPDQRGRGAGRALLKHCLDYLADRKVRCVKLDATPLGKGLYESVGFQSEWTLTRWESRIKAPIAHPLSNAPSPFMQASLPAVIELDRLAFGTCRKRLLEMLIADSRCALMQRDESNQAVGYALARAGTAASYMGPIVAAAPAVGLALVKALVARAPANRLYWDVPDQNSWTQKLAEDLGFMRQRELVRMFLGTNHSPGRPELQVGIADPAVG